MPPRDLILRTRAFALAVFRFCRKLPRTDEVQDTANHLRDAANSTRSNYRAARKGRSALNFRRMNARIVWSFYATRRSHTILRFFRRRTRSRPYLVEQSRRLE